MNILNRRVTVVLRSDEGVLGHGHERGDDDPEAETQAEEKRDCPVESDGLGSPDSKVSQAVKRGEGAVLEERIGPAVGVCAFGDSAGAQLGVAGVQEPEEEFKEDVKGEAIEKAKGTT